MLVFFIVCMLEGLHERGQNFLLTLAPSKLYFGLFL